MRKMRMFLVFSVAVVVACTANGHTIKMKREASSSGESSPRNSINLDVGGGSNIEVSVTHNNGQADNRLINLGYEYMGGSYYKFHAEGANWFAAKGICEGEGAYLVVIDDEAEAQLVANIFSQHPVTGTDNNDEMYIGLSDLQQEGVFITELGDRVPEDGYVRWRNSNPDDWRGFSSGGEDCVEMNRNTFMNDIHCHSRQAFTCEFNP